MKFQNYLFNVAINDLSIAKYSDDKTVSLIVEKNGEQHTDFNSIKFESAEKCGAWIDLHVSDRDACYNTARALNCLLDALRTDHEN